MQLFLQVLNKLRNILLCIERGTHKINSCTANSMSALLRVLSQQYDAQRKHGNRATQLCGNIVNQPLHPLATLKVFYYYCYLVYNSGFHLVILQQGCNDTVANKVGQPCPQDSLPIKTGRAMNSRGRKRRAWYPLHVQGQNIPMGIPCYEQLHQYPKITIQAACCRDGCVQLNSCSRLLQLRPAQLCLDAFLHECCDRQSELLMETMQL